MSDDAGIADIESSIAALLRLGMPKAQQNERTALVLLALLELKPGERWEQASEPMLGITQMMDWFRDHWGKNYAPNTRETVRRQSVHQIVAAGIAIPNPDDPARPTNSGKTVYQVTPEALAALRTVGSDRWPAAAEAFCGVAGNLAQRWAMERDQHRIPVTLPSGLNISLSAGGQNPVIEAVITEFCPRFAPGGHVLYVGDADDKWIVREGAALAALGIQVDDHGKMPDVVIHDTANGWLVLIEAVTSHGPMDPKRVDELKGLFANATVPLVFVTAFAGRTGFKRWVAELAWETEVWLADEPSHMIHWNGDRYLGPHV